ncbi:XisI protein [Candidatus Magnetomorum sp. HK-1]|nr:XisI protein [Candidatus Magnetomorum sp. HK-1]
MDQLSLYRDYIMSVIKKHNRQSLPGLEVEIQNIFDTKNDHYQLVHTGWHNKQRQYGCIIHVDIKNKKIWIQHDGTEIGIANELSELGIPKEDIILAYHPPYKRQYTGFGTG